MAVKIKICGLTNVANAKAIAQFDVDALGFVFYPRSPRYVSAQRAQQIIAQLPPFINKVGLFVNASQADIEAILSIASLDTLQFHGSEPPEDCARYSLPFIKAVGMDEHSDLPKLAQAYHHASALLLDSFQPLVHGGSGESFDWGLAQVKLDMPIVLSGGLSADNVKRAIEQVNPYAVDVSSGVEKEKGIKDIDKIASFIQQVKQ